MASTKPTPKWTPETIKAKILTSDIMLERSLLNIYSNQTSAEQLSAHTIHDNKIGFNGTDGEILSSFAEQVLKKTAADARAPFGGFVWGEGNRLSPKQRKIARKKMLKYSRQLLAFVKNA